MIESALAICAKADFARKSSLQIDDLQTSWQVQSKLVQENGLMFDRLADAALPMTGSIASGTILSAKRFVSVTGTNPITDYKLLKMQCLRSTGKTKRRGRESNPANPHCQSINPIYLVAPA